MHKLLFVPKSGGSRPIAVATARTRRPNGPVNNAVSIIRNMIIIKVSFV